MKVLVTLIHVISKAFQTVKGRVQIAGESSEKEWKKVLNGV